MSKEEQIALELVKISVNDTSGKKVLDRYKSYLEELKQDNFIEKEQAKLLDKIGTYRYILGAIETLLEHDENNFVLKDDLKEILGDIYD